jgi:adhesin HecA-like repeat protein
LVAGQDLTLNQESSNLTNVGGTISAGGNLNVLAANAVTNTGGNLLTNKDVNFTARSLNGDDDITAGGNLNRTLNSDFTNIATSQLQANGALSRMRLPQIL